MGITERDVRMKSQMVASNNQIDAIVYRCLFDGKNFHVYRRVNAGMGYRGNRYKTSGWVLAWSDISEYDNNNDAPNFVSEIPE